MYFSFSLGLKCADASKDLTQNGDAGTGYKESLLCVKFKMII